MDPTPTLHGKRVILEPLRVDHVDELWQAADERDLWTYMGHDVRTPTDLRQWVDARLAMPDAYAFLQRDAATGRAVGSTSLFDIDEAHRRMEIGHTWVGRRHRGTGVNAEAKLLLLTHAFDTMGANRVQLKCDDRNARSKAAIRRIGATFEGVLRRHMVLPDGHVRDTAMFSILRDEWSDVRQYLERLLTT